MEQPLRNPQFDEFGLLLDPEDWSPELARELASGDGIDELSEQHWAFIHACGTTTGNSMSRHHLHRFVTSWVWHTAAGTNCSRPAWPPGELPACRTRAKKPNPTCQPGSR